MTTGAIAKSETKWAPSVKREAAKAKPAKGEAARLLERKSVEEQRAILAAAIRSASYQCARVARHMYIGEADGAGFFSAMCDSGRDYMVSVKNGGSMESRTAPCSTLRAVAVECFKTF